MELPTRYSLIKPNEKWKVRQRYSFLQKGMCAHCSSPLGSAPPDFIQEKSIDWDLFPSNFLSHPVHLHHDHKTDMTIGTVHAKCNAILWQYHGK